MDIDAAYECDACKLLGGRVDAAMYDVREWDVKGIYRVCQMHYDLASVGTRRPHGKPILIEAIKTTPFSWKQLQEEQRPWVKHNFGDRPASQPLRGMAEELGEFFNDVVTMKSTADTDDALADFMIFVVDYCSARSWSIDEIIAHVPPSDWSRLYANMRFGAVLWVYYGRLCHADLKLEQGIRTHQDHVEGAKEALTGLIKLASSRFDKGLCGLLEVVEKTWSKVKLRDFKKDSARGGEE